MADDGSSEQDPGFKGVTLSIEVADDAEAERVFTAFGQGGNLHNSLRD
jgi:PhnB protein